MAIKNISRPFTSIPQASIPIQVKDNSWPHLNLVYKSLIAYSENIFSESPIIDGVVSAIIINSYSPDERERIQSSLVLKKIIENHKYSHPTVFRIVLSCFQNQKCSAELLDGISGFIKMKGLDTKVLFRNGLLPLFSSYSFPNYCLNLLNTCTSLISINSLFFEETISFLLSHWPSSTIQKQILFISVIESLFLSNANLITTSILIKVLRKFAELVEQPNIDLAEGSLNVILGPSIEKFILENPPITNSCLGEPLLNAAKKHWHSDIREGATLALEILSDINNEEFEKNLNNLKDLKKQRKFKNLTWKTNWAKVFQSAKVLDGSIRGANLDLFL